MLDSKASTEAPGKRISVILPDQTIERINRIKHATAASSVTDVIRNAILTYEALIEYSTDGNQFYLKKEQADTFVPVRFLFDIRRNTDE